MSATNPKPRQCRTCHRPLKGHTKRGTALICPTTDTPRTVAASGPESADELKSMVMIVDTTSDHPSSPPPSPSEVSVEIITQPPAIYPSLSHSFTATTVATGTSGAGGRNSKSNQKTVPKRLPIDTSHGHTPQAVPTTGNRTTSGPFNSPNNTNPNNNKKLKNVELIQSWLTLQTTRSGDPRNQNPLRDLTHLPFPPPMHPITLPALEKLKQTPQYKHPEAVTVFEARRENLGVVHGICNQVGLYFSCFSIPGVTVSRSGMSEDNGETGEGSPTGTSTGDDVPSVYTRVGGDVWILVGRTPGSVDDARVILRDADEKELVPLDDDLWM